MPAQGSECAVIGKRGSEHGAGRPNVLEDSRAKRSVLVALSPLR